MILSGYRTPASDISSDLSTFNFLEPKATHLEQLQSFIGTVQTPHEGGLRFLAPVCLVDGFEHFDGTAQRRTLDDSHKDFAEANTRFEEGRMGGDLFTAFQSGGRVIRVETIERERSDCPFVQDDKELEVFNDIDGGNVGQRDDLAWFAQLVIPEIREVNTFISPVN
jgi:hypothetical protein